MPAISLSKTLLPGLVLAAIATASQAQNYPARPVRFVTSFAPGGNADIVVRILAEGLSKNLGQPFITDNRPGASSVIGTHFVAKAPADGYTLLMVSSSHAVNPTLVGKDLPYDTQKDFVGVAKVGSTPMVLAAYPGLGVSSVKELIAKAKAAPGTINFASSGNGSPAHMAGALFNAMAGVKTTHVPYKSTQQGVTDAMGGQIQLAYPSLSAAGELVKTGRLRALGITSSKRSPLLPGVPTVAETLPGYQAEIWNGVVAPAGVPRPIIKKLNAEIVKVLNSPDVKAKLAKLGVEVDTSTPEEFDAFLDSEIKKSAEVLKAGQISADVKR